MNSGYILFIVLLCVLFYVVSKERVEHGCSGSFSIATL